MINNRQSQPSTKSYHKSIRPQTAYSKTTSIPSRLSLRIDSIITSLENNVKDLKNHYQMRNKSKVSLSLEKSKHKFRLKKIKNESHCPHSYKENVPEELIHSDLKEKQLTDVFELKQMIFRTYGRDTNNIVELYQFYKKNVEKRDKSTRILASIDISNPNMGLSQQGQQFNKIRAKEPLSKQENVNVLNKEQKQLSSNRIISQKLESSSKYQHSSNFGQGNPKKMSKPSNLAHQLMSKGLYNMANVANLMLSKKYKLTKEKEESFQKVVLQREKNKTLKIEQPKENNGNLLNVRINEQKQQCKKVSNKKDVPIDSNDGNNVKISHNSSQNMLDLNASFDSSGSRRNVGQFSLQSNKKAQISSKAKDGNESSEFKLSSIKKIQQIQPKLDDLSSLQESPIVVSKSKDFSKSKYYVQPIPVVLRKKQEQQEKSITLQSNSRIIDIDCLPFDL